MKIFNCINAWVQLQLCVANLWSINWRLLKNKGNLLRWNLIIPSSWGPTVTISRIFFCMETQKIIDCFNNINSKKIFKPKYRLETLWPSLLHTHMHTKRVKDNFIMLYSLHKILWVLALLWHIKYTNHSKHLPNLYTRSILHISSKLVR